MDGWSRDEQRVRWSVGDDARVRDKTELWAKTQCKSVLDLLGECTKGKTLSVAWSCTEQRNAYTTCLKNYTSQRFLEIQKRESISKRLASMQQAEALEKKIRKQ
ncbi:hypothetical protein AAMO2058_001660600 [Amorphochlora amoebiformis]